MKCYDRRGDPRTNFMGAQWVIRSAFLCFRLQVFAKNSIFLAYPFVRSGIFDFLENPVLEVSDFFLSRSLVLQGRFEIADICLVSAFSKARSGLRKPRFLFRFFRGKPSSIEMGLYLKLV